MKCLIFTLLALAVIVQPCFSLINHTSARAIGMGGAFTAIADDPMAFRYNPAGYGFINNDQLLMSSYYFPVKTYIKDMPNTERINSVFSMSSRVGMGSVGLFYSQDDMITYYTVPPDDLHTRGQTVGIAYGFRLLPNLSVGFKASAYNSYTSSVSIMDEYNTYSSSADFGFLARLTQRLSFGAVLRNIFPGPIKGFPFGDIKTYTYLRLGLAYSPVQWLVIAADEEKNIQSISESWDEYLGAEWHLSGSVTIRGGVNKINTNPKYYSQTSSIGASISLSDSIIFDAAQLNDAGTITTSYSIRCDI